MTVMFAGPQLFVTARSVCYIAVSGPLAALAKRDLQPLNFAILI